MLDIKKIRENKEEVAISLKKRLGDVDLGLDDIINLDDKRKIITSKLENLKSEKNNLSKNKPDQETIEKIKLNNIEIKKIEEELNEVKALLGEKMSSLPNIVADEVVSGGKENNKVFYTFKDKPEFSFKPLDHVDLSEKLEIIDYKRAAKLSGSGFCLYKNEGALIEWALINYFIDFHNKNNYNFIIPPLLLNEESAYASGHMPKFRDDLFWVEDGLCLNGTAEMMLGNYHRDEMLGKEELPLKYFSYAPSFRREAGSYRKEERGMIRGHQFNKVEMFQYVEPSSSWEVFEEMKEQASNLLKGLDLHFQLSDLAAGDCSAAMAKTVDIEIWIPSMNIYKEVSSISNALDYQTRRSNTRVKDSDGSKFFPHTLNASGLATSRLLPAILEQNQQEDGSVLIPKALVDFIPGKIDRIKLKK